MTALWVALGGAIGAPLRFGIDYAVKRWWQPRFDWGIWLANLAGSLLLGLVVGAASHGLSAEVTRLLGTGMCGALTTFSTFSIATWKYLDTGHPRLAAANVVGTLAACQAVFVVGWWLAS